MLYLQRTLADGSTAVTDSEDGATFILKEGQWSAVLARPIAEQRGAAEAFVLQNRTSGDPRSEVDQQVIQQSEQGQGERHEQSEEAQ